MKFFFSEGELIVDKNIYDKKGMEE